MKAGSSAICPVCLEFVKMYHVVSGKSLMAQSISPDTAGRSEIVMISGHA